MAGLLCAVVLTGLEWVQLLVGSQSPLVGLSDHLQFWVCGITVFGFVTVFLGLGFGLSIHGFVRWLNPGTVWKRLAEDASFRQDKETAFAALVLWIPIAIVLVGAATYVVQVAVVHNKMSRATFAGAFMALSVISSSAIVLSLSGLCITVLKAVLSWLPMRFLSRKEPRLLRGTLLFVAVAMAVGVGIEFAFLYNPTVWSLGWVFYLASIVLLPPILSFTPWVVRRSRLIRSVPRLIVFLLSFMGLSAWTFTSLEHWDEPRFAIVEDAEFLPTVAQFVHRLTDFDGDGQSSVLGGGDCDDSEPGIYSGANEIPGNGVDENCLGHDGPFLTEVSSGENNWELARPTARNIVIILLDTLRPDHLGFFGYEREISPHIDALASESLVFTRAYAQAPHTPRSIPSIFTSRYPHHVAFEDPVSNFPRLNEENLTFFEVLDDNGYFNLAVTSHFYFVPSRRIDQGFDHWDNRGSLSSDETKGVSAAPLIFEHFEEHVEHLSQLDEPFTLFIHYFEPHELWLSHDDVVDFGSASGRQQYINDYDSEIAFADQYVGLTLERLDEVGLIDDSIIVFLSDHGEAFEEHDRYYHGQALYEEEIHVPLFIRIPGVQPDVIDTPVALLDVAPTLLNIVGVEIPPSFEGRVLAPPFSALEVEPIFTELLPYANFQGHATAMILGDDKLILDVAHRRYESYDLSVDPDERLNLTEHTLELGAMEEQLLNWMEY